MGMVMGSRGRGKVNKGLGKGRGKGKGKNMNEVSESACSLVCAYDGSEPECPVGLVRSFISFSLSFLRLILCI